MEKKCKARSLSQNALEFIQINHQNKIVELPDSMHIMQASSFLISLTPFEDNLGGEINTVIKIV